MRSPEVKLARLNAPIPPTTPVTPAIKLWCASHCRTVIGGLTGYKAGEEGTDLLLGEEQPVSPGTRIQHEMGKTAASGLGWLRHTLFKAGAKPWRG